MRGHVAVALLLLAASPALAQPSEPSERVTIFAPYVVRKAVSGPSRERVTTITMSRDVSYRDLDLTGGPGVTILVARVREAARAVCRELDRRYPRSVYVPVTREQDCAQKATEDGMIQVNAILAGLRA